MIQERKLKICLVSNRFPPEDGGGIGTYIYNLAKSLLQRGHKIVVITIPLILRIDVSVFYVP